MEVRNLLFYAMFGGGVVAGILSAQGPQTVPPSEAPRYDAEGRLIAPANYREWVYLSSGMGMTYNDPPAAGASAPPRRQNFSNVFVNPSSYRAFLQTGTWPDKTTLVLEIRGSESEGSINKGGQFQGAVRAMEVEVKDENRFAGKWAFFDIDLASSRGAQLPADRNCYSCHAQNGAVDNTFVQFYPTLAEVARQKGTFRETPAK